MKLNPDCIRDILLVVEDKSSFSNAVWFEDLKSSNLVEKYDLETIFYHIRQAFEAGFLLDVKNFAGGNFYIKDLSPKGHEFLANIRKDNNWSKTKEIANKVGSFSLKTLTTIASNVVTSSINHHLGL
ncbi:DUF2513 domain-containing protein [Ligilactobacillus salivarius]|uniref:DUF2513 domain-containing protein n=1 Tax=Ligilactobacillus salivarius TaxID=1624 RepID=UPI00237DFEDE|nr:DUF2513 domain-containing protein [Ligilactobacillus salivarius]MDE1523310.1 DUF2513 domain-containing protein [Ligilactobacillus salivarius]